MNFLQKDVTQDVEDLAVDSLSSCLGLLDLSLVLEILVNPPLQELGLFLFGIAHFIPGFLFSKFQQDFCMNFAGNRIEIC